MAAGQTFLLSRETVRAFLSFKNRNINLDQCQSFFPLCLQLVTHLCLLFPLKTQTSQKHCVWMSRYDARGGSMLRVLLLYTRGFIDRCPVRTPAGQMCTSRPTRTSCPKPTEEKHDQYLLHVRQRTRTITVSLCVDSTVGASFCPGVFTFDTSDKSSSDI